MPAGDFTYMINHRCFSFGEPWSLFNPEVHDAHYAALRLVLQTKRTPR
jgi:hypothetical protein